MDEHCFFCNEPLRQDDRPVDRHHRLPKRYCNSQEKRDRSNIVYAHCDCHARWHRVHDATRVNRQTFIRLMAPRNYGYGIFAAASGD